MKRHRFFYWSGGRGFNFIEITKRVNILTYEWPPPLCPYVYIISNFSLSSFMVWGLCWPSLNEGQLSWVEGVGVVTHINVPEWRRGFPLLYLNDRCMVTIRPKLRSVYPSLGVWWQSGQNFWTWLRNFRTRVWRTRNTVFPLYFIIFISGILSLAVYTGSFTSDSGGNNKKKKFVMYM